MLAWPEWFGAKQANREEILTAVDTLHPFPCFIELRRASWVDGEAAEETFAFLEEHGLSFVCVDEPQDPNAPLPSIVTATAPQAMLRLHGRNTENWMRRDLSNSERVRYLYTDDELRQWAERIRELCRQTTTMHVLFANTWQDFAVHNAATLITMLSE